MAYLADYQIVVYDTSGNLVDIIPADRPETIHYTRVLNDVGQLDITLDGNDPAAAYMTSADYFLEVLRRNTPEGAFEVEGTYLLRYCELFQDSDTGLETLILGGRSLEDFLNRRRVLPANDPLGAAGFSTKQGFGDVVMTEYVDEQMVTASAFPQMAIPGLSVLPTLGIGFIASERRKQEDVMLTTLQDIANQTRVDFSIVRTSGALFEFRPAVQGTDRSMTANYPLAPFTLLTPARGNMQNPRLVYNRYEEVNYAFMAGQGPEQDRVYYPVAGVGVDASPFNLVVGVFDSRESETTDQLVASASAELFKVQAKAQFEFEPIIGAAGCNYNIDMFLGDIITASFGGFQADYRLTAFEITITADGETISPTVTEYLRST
jgi:hypothetical protein